MKTTTIFLNFLLLFSCLESSLFNDSSVSWVIYNKGVTTDSVNYSGFGNPYIHYFK